MALEKNKVIEFLKGLKLKKNDSAFNEYQDGVNCAIECVNESIDTRIDMLKNDMFFSCEENIASLILTLENDCKDIEGNKEFDNGFVKTVKPIIKSLQKYLTSIKHT